MNAPSARRTARRIAGSAGRPVLALLAVLLVSVPLVAQRGQGFGGFPGFQPVPPSSATVPYDGWFTFVRMSYPVGFSRRGAPWSHDYPIGEQSFLRILTTVTNVRAHVEQTSILSFSDPDMFKFPVLYLVEPGYWLLDEEEAVALRSFLLKGGFLIVDDFPSEAWPNFEVQMHRVFPDGQWIELGADHPVFHSFFEIDPFSVLPPYDRGGRPMFRALFADNDLSARMYAIANFQNDVSEYWEWSDEGVSVVDQTNEAYKIGVNEFLYGIMH